MSVSKVQFEYDKELKHLSMSVNDRPWETLSIRDLEPMEKLLKEMEIPYESSVGEMMGDVEFLQYQYENDSLYNLGVEAGINLMKEEIQKQCELSAKALLENFNREAEKERKYIVPICRKYGNQDKREMLIKANSAETAMFIAIRDLECNGWYNPWIVDRDFDNYKCLE